MSISETPRPKLTPLQILQRALRWLASEAAAGAAYDSWPPDITKKQIREVWLNTGREYVLASPTLTVAEIATIDVADLRALGFGYWDGDLMVIPLWAFNIVADGEMLTSINGRRAVKGKDKIDLDTRFGCIAYGFNKPHGGAEK